MRNCGTCAQGLVQQVWHAWSYRFLLRVHFSSVHAGVIDFGCVQPRLASRQSLQHASITKVRPALLPVYGAKPTLRYTVMKVRSLFEYPKICQSHVGSWGLRSVTCAPTLSHADSAAGAWCRNSHSLPRATAGHLRRHRNRRQAGSGGRPQPYLRSVVRAQMQLRAAGCSRTSAGW